jgi:hypothetical protein
LRAVWGCGGAGYYGGELPALSACALAFRSGRAVGTV